MKIQADNEIQTVKVSENVNKTTENEVVEVKTKATTPRKTVAKKAQGTTKKVETEKNIPQEKKKEITSSELKKTSSDEGEKLMADLEEAKIMSKRPEIVLIKIYLSRLYEFRYDTVSNEIQSRLKVEEGKEHKKYEDSNYADLFCELLEKGFKVSENVLTAILSSSYVPKIDFFKSYFESLTYEQQPSEIDKLAGYLKVKTIDRSRFDTQFKKFLVRSVACSIDAGYFNKQCLTIIGKQNDGKSTFCEFLCPPSLANFLQRGLNGDVKDQQITLTSNFIINLDELASFGKFELNGLKSLFSQAYVKVRPPYGKKSIRTQRRANFVASTNDKDFLNDPTGSVRWLCFEIESIDFNYSKEVNIDKVWAEAYFLYKKNGVQKYEMTKEELRQNEAANKQFTSSSVEEDLIEKYFVPSNKTDKNAMFYTATDLMTAIHIREERIRVKKVPIGKAAVSLGFERVKHQGLYGYFATVRTNVPSNDTDERFQSKSQMQLDLENAPNPDF